MITSVCKNFSLCFIHITPFYKIDWSTTIIKRVNVMIKLTLLFYKQQILKIDMNYSFNLYNLSDET